MSITIDPAFIAQAVTQRTHYTRVRSDWHKGLVAIFAGDELEAYIMKYSEHENTDKLDERRKKAVYFYKGMVKRIHNQYVEGVFGAGAPVRTSENPTLTAWLNGQYADWVKRELVRHQLALPEQYIRVRRRAPAERGFAVDPETVADVDEMQLFPEPCVIDPEFVQNFSQDETGLLEWVTLIHKGKDKKGNDCTHLEIITDRERVVVSEDGKKIIEAPAPHDFTRCPVVRMVYEENRLLGGNVGHAFMAEVVSLCLATLNIDAMAVEAIVQHLSPKLVTDGKTAESILKQGIGAHNLIIEGDGNAGAITGVTRYLQMNGFEIETLLDLSYDKLPNQVMEAARLRDRTANASASGLAKLLDSAPEINAIKDIATHFQLYDQRIGSLLAEGYQPGLTCTTVYPTYEATEESVTGQPVTDEPTPETPAKKRGGLRESTPTKEATA
jgi:hypothetical protein